MALDRGRRRCQDNRKLADAAAHDGEVAGLVVNAVILLEARSCSSSTTMRPRSLNGRNSAERAPTIDASFARSSRAPRPASLGRRQRRMPLDRLAAEARRKAAHELPRERDLGQHDEGLTPETQRLGDGLVINLGLARAGHAVEQTRR